VKDYEQAGTQFKKLLRLDPHKINNVDVYANVLFLTEQRTKLTRLGLDLLTLEKDRPEVCYLIGQYNGLVSEMYSRLLLQEITTPRKRTTPLRSSFSNELHNWTQPIFKPGLYLGTNMSKPKILMLRLKLIDVQWVCFVFLVPCFPELTPL